eukprot:867879-Amphidinium_carterae.1
MVDMVTHTHRKASRVGRCSSRVNGDSLPPSSGRLTLIMHGASRPLADEAVCAKRAASSL